MIKRIFLIIIFLFVLPFNVYAERKINHIAFVEEFRINEEQDISIKGYAYFSHQDNYGINKNGEGNLETHIVAYTGAWNEDYMHPNKCDNSDRCVRFKTEPIDRSFWLARCVDDVCAKFEKNINMRKNIDDTYSFFNDTSCHNGDIDRNCLYENVGFETTFNLIENIVSPLSGGRESFDGNIKFKIVSINKDLYNFNESKYSCPSDKSCLGIANSSLAVYSENCYIGGDELKSNGKSEGNDDNSIKITSGSYSFEISNLNPKVEFDARIVIPRTSDGTSLPQYYKNKGVDIENYSKKVGYFEYDVDYYVKKISRNVSLEKKYGSYLGTYSDTLVQLASKFESNELTKNQQFDICGNWCTYPYLIKPVDNIKNNDIDKDDDEYDYWTTATNLIFKGDVTISNIKPEYYSFDCDRLFDSDGFAVYDTIDNVTVDCSSNKSKTLTQCTGDKKDGKEKIGVNGRIYVKTSNYGGTSCNTHIKKSSDGEGYLLPITVKANILINQRGVITFDSITNEKIRAGKAFAFDEYNFDNKTSPLNYTFYLEWAYLDWNIYNTNVLPYHDFAPVPPLYNAKNYGYVNKMNGRSCEADSSFSLKEFLKNSNEFFYEDIDGNVSKADNLDDALLMAIDAAVQDEIYIDGIKTLTRPFNGWESNVYNENYTDWRNLNNVFNGKIKLESCKSNSSSLFCEDDYVGGKWQLINAASRIINANIGNADVNVGRRSWYSLNYILPNAYIALSSNIIHNGINYNYGDILYDNVSTIVDLEGKKFKYLGNKYFVPFKFADKIFPFDLDEDTNPSVVENMMWTLNGTCGIEVDNGLFDDVGNPLYKYRSISLTSPFPRADVLTGFGVPINWKEWMFGSNKDNNIDRLNNTYYVGDSKKYSIVISKLDGINNATSISSINDYGNDRFYGDITNFQDNKYSKFVSDNFNGKANNNTYCGLGFFSSSCDSLR